MANLALVNPSTNALFKTTVGILSDSGSNFPVEIEPDKVIKYTPNTPAGIVLTKNTSNPTSPGSGEWGFYDGYVYLGDTLQQGESAVATTGTEALLEMATTLSGTNYFDVSQSDANYRTKLQRVRLTWVGAGEELQNVQISLGDFLESAGSETSHYALAPDVDGQPGTFGSQLTSTEIPELASLKWMQSVYFWVRCVKPQGSDSGTFADVTININGTRYKYPRSSILISEEGYTWITLSGLDHPYLVPFVRYVRVSGSSGKYYFPYIYFNTSTFETRLGVHNPPGNVTEVHYVIQPIDHLNNSGELEITSGTGIGHIFSNASCFPVWSMILHQLTDTMCLQMIEDAADTMRYYFGISKGFDLLSYCPPSPLNQYETLSSTFGEDIRVLPTAGSAGVIWSENSIPAYGLVSVVPAAEAVGKYKDSEVCFPFTTSLTSTRLYIYRDDGGGLPLGLYYVIAP
ncbi:MAG: hypothetical protein DRP50_07945 [Thermotoga sp.]|nr:MAG: hypothetical protein DRP50_07945 [Thermotoga sp.]